MKFTIGSVPLSPVNNQTGEALGIVYTGFPSKKNLADHLNIFTIR
ncbi:MAG TPA: hypothetical protein PK711_05570 [Bacteroidales bacterium]|nr:hypothetical protein [Bacteroidales bacterium]